MAQGIRRAAQFSAMGDAANMKAVPQGGSDKGFEFLVTLVGTFSVRPAQADCDTVYM